MSMKNSLKNLTLLEKKKKSKKRIEIVSTSGWRINTQTSRKDSMERKGRLKRKLRSLKIKMRLCRKRIIFYNLGKSIWNSRLKLWLNRKCSCSRRLVRARVKSKKTSRGWRMPWWLTTTTKLISSQLRNASNKQREWLIWAQLPCRIFLRFFSSLRLKSYISFLVTRLS